MSRFLGDFSGPKSNFQIEIKQMRARVLASKLLHFVSLTDGFILLDAKLLKPLSCWKQQQLYQPVDYQDFRKTAPRTY